MNPDIDLHSKKITVFRNTKINKWKKKYAAR